MYSVTPFLMFNNQTGEAVEFYTSIIKNSKITSTTRQGDKVMSATFELDGRTFMAYDGGSYFSFSDGISMYVSCETQAEIDELWAKLSEGGKEVQCGWLKDRFGVSWQIIPSILGKLLGDPDPDRAQRAKKAMLGMVKLDIEKLKQAADGA